MNKHQHNNDVAQALWQLKEAISNSTALNSLMRELKIVEDALTIAPGSQQSLEIYHRGYTDGFVDGAGHGRGNS